jgi:CheY-like chemotaxis protein
MIFNAPVLYAEDDENDSFLLNRAFGQAEIINPLVIVSDGNAAIDYLAGNGAHAQRETHPFPCLVLLDLKMPGKSGLDVLEWLQNQPSISTLPILMLTSSSQEKDVRRAYQLGANGYLLKPSTPDGMLSLAKAIKDFWLSKNLYIGPATRYLNVQ